MRNPINVAYTAMDARIEEIFWGIYQRNPDGFAELLGQEAVIGPAEVTIPSLSGAGVGSGWAVYENTLINLCGTRVLAIESQRLPRARAIAHLGVYGLTLGQAVAAEHAMPVYLRDKVAKTEAERFAAKSA